MGGSEILVRNEDRPSSEVSAKMKLCSICVNTYKRPELLAELLDSLARQIVSEEISLEVIVVDNDFAASARTVVQQVASGALPIRYFVEPVQNISLARNKAVSEARGSYILFIDDDESACPEWVQTLVDTVERFQVDGAFGRVVPEFDEAAPEWIRGMYMYYTPRGATGTRSRFYASNNAIVKAERLRGEEMPFDPKYGRTGGEDVDMFSRLVDKGAKFIDCSEAVVTEFQPLYRTNPDWLLDRARRTGALYAKRSVERSNSRIVFKTYLCSKAVVFYFVNLLLKTLSAFDRPRNLHHQIKMSAYIGHIQGVLGKQIIGY